MRKIFERKASIEPLKSKLKIDILDEADVKSIFDTALKILAEVGMFLPHQRALELYSDAGAKVDFKNQIVKIPDHVVTANIKKAPGCYTFAARDRSELDLKIGGKSGTYFCTGGIASFAVDFTTCKKRPSREEDVIAMAKIVDYISAISYYYMSVSSTEYLKTGPLHELKAAFNNTEKHVQTEDVIGENQTKYAIEIASVIAGGKNRLREKPILSSLVCTTPPLIITKEAIDSILMFSEVGIPVGVMSMPTMGATAPASQAGALAVGLAEVLSGCVLTQLANPGAPNFISIIPGIVDPRSGEYFYASTFSQVANAAAVQLAHFCGIPIQNGASFGGSADKLNDWQIGKENLYLPLLSVMSGADMCYGMGLIDSVNVWNAARTLFDREIFEAIKIVSSGIEVTEDSLSFDIVRRVGPKGHFLGQKETAVNLPKLWPPSIVLERSKQSGEKYKDPVMISWDEVKWIIENHRAPKRDDRVQAEITKILKVAEEKLA
jgi:trimethylamine--corrinoid protein Co-methyltransferase